MNLYEKLNRLDDSLVESIRVVNKRNLTESLAANDYELTYHGNSAGRDRRPETIEDVLNDWKTVVFRADSDLDAWKEAFERVTGNHYDDFLNEDATEADFSRYFDDSDWSDGSPILIKLSSAESVLYDTGYTQESWIEEYVEDSDYEDNIEEMLTEGNNVSSQIPTAIDSFLQDIAQMYKTIDYADIMQHEYCEEDLRKLKNLRRRFRAEVAYEGNEESDAILQSLADEVAKIVKNNMITENRWNPYFTPYGYRDAAKVLNGKAPEYYYHLKEIEMDTGDGIKLAKYALRKSLPVMVDKNSDPDYPEFAIKGEYHWDDYFYPYPTAHEEDLIAWDGKMFVEEQLTEGRHTSAIELIANQIVEYATEHPDSLKNFKYMYDYIDNLSQEGKFEIPAKVGPFVLEDPENVTEDEAETFINMLLDETDVGDRLIQIKEANRKAAWDKLRKEFPSI